MRTSIRIKFIISYLFLLVFVLCMMNFYGLPTIQNSMMQDKKASLYEEANLVAQDYASDINTLNTTLSSSIPQLRKQFNALQAMTDTRFWLIDNSGQILLDSKAANNKEGYNINHYSPSFLGNQSMVVKSLGGLLSNKSLAVIYPLTTNMTTKGYIVLLSPIKPIYTKASEYVDTIIICFFLFFGVLFVLFLYLDHQVSKPLRIMTNAAKEYAIGHFDYTPEKIMGHDYQELAGAIDYLAEKMNNMNEYQKRFVANISHDFRSPLTSIKGYAEAIADGTIPQEMQGKYLDIILFETGRLTKLTNNLLELNQFESKGMLLDISTFDINKVIKLVTASFEQRCTAKHISIELTFCEKTLLVDADENKIEQVIQNLVDNAIKFSHPDSSLEIHTLERTGKVFVSVKDHGIGIPKDSISKVWARFYKTDLSRGRDKTGTGLGLSITKEIVEAHGENINVISTEGAGTEFIFSLKEHDPAQLPLQKSFSE